MNKVRQLYVNEFGRYALDDFTEFHCGDVIEIYVFDSKGNGRWERTYIESSDGDYYAVKFPALSLQGLWARVPER